MKGDKGTQFVDNYIPRNDALVELINGKIVDVVGGKYFPEGTKVVIKGDKILAMPGLSGEPVDIKPDYTIDLGGMTVLPGLFNTHCHAVSVTISTFSPSINDIQRGKKYRDVQIANNMAECLAHGITTIRDCLTYDLRSLRPWMERISKGEIPGPRIYQTVVVGPPGNYMSHKIDLQWKFLFGSMGMSVIDYASKDSGSLVFPIDASEQQVRDAVNRAIDERGAEYIKDPEQLEDLVTFKPTNAIMTEKQLEALTDQTQKRGLKSTMHHVSVASFRRGVKYGISSLGHAPIDADLTQADVDALVSSGRTIEPTVSIAFALAWRVKQHATYNDPQMLHFIKFREEKGIWDSIAKEFWIPQLNNNVVSAMRRTADGNMKAMGIKDASTGYRYYSTIVTHGANNVAKLFESGAKIACANDGGVTAVVPSDIKSEINMFDFVLNSGATRKFKGIDAVRMATINSAQALGLEDRLGSIQPGKIADLALIDGDPLADLHLVGSRVAALFVNGKLKVNNCNLKW